jgi:hypothetical protein
MKLAKEEFTAEMQAEYNKLYEEYARLNSKNAAMHRFEEAAKESKNDIDRYRADPTQYNKEQMEKSGKKLDTSLEEINKFDVSEIFTSLYNKYSEFLDSLSPDKIVCMFNIIIDGLILSSFFSLLSLMLSENIINKISFLDKYPKILKLLKLRNNINKKVSKFYLLIHFIILIAGILGNIFMFFIK